MAMPTNRQEFKEFCLRQLGHPTIEINIDDEQVEDCIDMALSYYADYHYDGSEKVYLAHEMTQEDKDRRYLIMDEKYIGVISIMDLNTVNTASGMFSIRYQMALNDFFNMSYTSLIPYWLTMRHIEMLQDFFSGRPPIRWNRHTNRLYIDMDWDADIQVGQFMVIECHRIVPPEDYPDVWKDRWLIHYTTTLIKKLWGEHLSKFNITLPGNITWNGDRILQEATQEKLRLEQEMIWKYSYPVGEMYG